MHGLTRTRLEHLRERLSERGQRPSMFMASQGTPPGLLEAVHVVEEWGAFVEAMYLVMAADHRVVASEREVLRGALDLLAGNAIRTRHMDAMLDAASRNVAEAGAQRRLQHVIEDLRRDPARAETAFVLAAAIAAADQRIVAEEHAMLNQLAEGLGITPARVAEVLSELETNLGA